MNVYSPPHDCHINTSFMYFHGKDTLTRLEMCEEFSKYLFI